MTNRVKESVRRWQPLRILVALIALGFLGLATDNVLAGKLTDTTAGLATRPSLKSDKLSNEYQGSAKPNQQSSAPAKSAPNRPLTNDAFVYFSDPATATYPGESVCPDGPPCQISGVDGTVPYPIEMWVNPGSDPHTDLAGQQSYLSFTNSIMQVVDPNTPSCLTSREIFADTEAGESTYFWRLVLQDQVCNGPNACDFQGLPADPGSIAYASGLATGGIGSTAGPPDGQPFRLAVIYICAQANGISTIHWQFSPPAPINRDSQIVTADGVLVEDRTLYTDVSIEFTHIVLQ